MMYLGKRKTYRFACAFCGRMVTMEARNQKEAFKRIRSILFRWKKMWLKTTPSMVSDGFKQPLTDEGNGWVCPNCIEHNFIRCGYFWRKVVARDRDRFKAR